VLTATWCLRVATLVLLVLIILVGETEVVVETTEAVAEATGVVEVDAAQRRLRVTQWWLRSRSARAIWLV
jgi:hypothetical protein